MRWILILLILCSLSLVYSLIFFLLIKIIRGASLGDSEVSPAFRDSHSSEKLVQDFSYLEAFKLSTTAMALNKLIFTGLGYLTSGYLSYKRGIGFSQVLGIFALLEFFSAFLWITLGIYFGAEIALKIPLALVIAIIVLLGIFLWRKKKKISSNLKIIITTFVKIGNKFCWIVPLVILSIVLKVFYYQLLFQIFGFFFDFWEVLRIASVSFTIGYLSPAPAGLGFKETGLVFLLKGKGILLGSAISVAVVDRIIITLFWAILGGVVGFDFVKAEIRKRFRIFSKR